MPTITVNQRLVQPMLENKSVFTLKTVSIISCKIGSFDRIDVSITDTAERSSVVTRRCEPKSVFGVHCKYESQGYDSSIVCTCDSDNCNRDYPDHIDSIDTNFVEIYDRITLRIISERSEEPRK